MLSGTWRGELVKDKRAVERSSERERERGGMQKAATCFGEIKKKGWENILLEN